MKNGSNVFIQVVCMNYHQWVSREVTHTLSWYPNVMFLNWRFSLT